MELSPGSQPASNEEVVMEYLRGGSVLWVDLSTGRVWREPTGKYDSFGSSAEPIDERLQIQ